MDRLFVDTNVFVASLTDEPGRGATATALLNLDRTFQTSLVNLMELRSVLTKKKMVEQREVERVIQDIEESVELVFPDTSDVLSANSLQQETLLYPMDCLVLALARDQDGTLVTFDAELRDVDAVSPETVLGDAG